MIDINSNKILYKSITDISINDGNKYSLSLIKTDRSYQCLSMIETKESTT